MGEHSIVRKTIVFAIFFVVLVIIAPTIVFYSLGYRFNKGTSEVIRSGSIVFKATPAQPEISLDGNKVSQTSMDLINRSLNINGLETKDYQVEVSAPGYYPWNKKIEVRPGVATEFWNIVLIPQENKPDTLAEDSIVKFAFSPDKKKIANFVIKENTISLFVKEQGLDRFVYKETLNQSFIPEPGELKWSADSQWLLFSLKKTTPKKIFLGNDGTGFSQLVELDDAWRSLATQADNNPNTNKKAIITNPDSYTWDDQENIFVVIGGKAFFQSASSLLELSLNESGVASGQNETKTSEPQKIILKGSDLPAQTKENINGFAFCGGYLCSINAQEKKLEVSNKDGSLRQTVSFPDSYQMTDKYQIFAYAEDRVSILDANNNLFIWDEAQNKTEGREGMKFIFSGVKDVYFSDDGKKSLFSTEKEAYVYFVRDSEVQPKHVVGDLEVVYRDPDELKKVQWFLDYQNVFVVNKDGVKLIELDSRGGRNSADFLKQSNISEISYDINAKKLWYLEEGDSGFKKLQEIAFPLSTNLFSGLINLQNTNK